MKGINKEHTKGPKNMNNSEGTDYGRGIGWVEGVNRDMWDNCKSINNKLFLYLKQLLMYLFFIVVEEQLPPFSLHHSTPHPCLPLSNLSPLALSMCPLYVFIGGPFPIIPYYPSPLSSLVTVILFFISMSRVVFCLLVWLVD